MIAIWSGLDPELLWRSIRARLPTEFRSGDFDSGELLPRAENRRERAAVSAALVLAAMEHIRYVDGELGYGLLGEAVSLLIGLVIEDP